MDRIGFRELLRAGVATCERRFHGVVEARPDNDVGPRDAEIELVLDRLAQIGITVVRHDLAEAWDELLGALLTIFRIAIPAKHNYYSVAFPPRNADFLLAVIERVLLLGSYANRQRRYALAKRLVIQLPEEGLPHYYWLRYAVTMAARGELTSFHGKKSLIPIASEYVRTRPEFFQLFSENMDEAVNDMCQFDFFNCVLAVHLAGDTDECYPNFGLYWNHRTTPIVGDLVTGGPAREALPEIDDAHLAELLVALDKLAAKVFFGFSGWHRGFWGDERIVSFLRKHAPST